MSLQLQICIIVASVLLFWILVRTVKKNKLRTEYATGWIICSIMLIVVAVFPQIAYFMSDLLHIMSPANMVFAIILFFLLVLLGMLFSKVSALEEKEKNLVQEIAILKECNNLKIAHEQPEQASDPQSCEVSGSKQLPRNGL